MRRSIVLSVGLVVACVLAALGCGNGRSESTVVDAGALRLDVALEPPGGQVGDNHLWLTVTDADGAPLSDAELRVKVHMVAMGAMPAMGGFAEIEPLGEGEYRADFSLEMGSTWIVEIDAAPPDGDPARVEGSFTVGSPGVRLRAEGAAAAPAPGSTDRASLDARHPAEFSLDPGRIQKVGVRTAAVEEAALSSGVRTVGRVVVDETRIEEVSPKVAGWIERLDADAEGVSVERGEVLFTVYSPELYAAQEELLLAHRSEGALSASLLRSAKRRLRLWGVAPGDIDGILARGEPRDALPFRAPSSGVVLEKHVVEGSAIQPGQRLMRIAPLDPIWIEVDLYEADLARVSVGQTASITLSHLPGAGATGTVTFLHPTLSGETRTARARIELENPERLLKPDMFANVALQTGQRRGLVVPESAVLHTGDRAFVFLALGGGRFRPQQVEVGAHEGARIEIVSGLEAGDEVVSSGTFLIASESRLRAALEQW